MTFKKPVLLIFALSLATPVLGGCESVRNEQAGHDEAPVTVAPATVNNQLTPTFSNGSVEVYNLDGGGVASVPSVVADPFGVPMANDPRVVLYPLDGPATDYFVPAQTTSAAVASPSVSSIYFPYGSSKLDRVDQEALRDVVQTAKFAPVDRVSVEGHASASAQVNDPVKAKILNLKESMNRAAAVSEHLIKTGVPAEKIKTVGWGDTKPSGADEAGERRVDIITGGY